MKKNNNFKPTLCMPRLSFSLSGCSYFNFFLALFIVTYSSTAIANSQPKSFEVLARIQDKESFEYQSAAFHAAMDALSMGKEALAAKDSTRALKLLSAAASLLPWRGDIISLRNLTLDTYINITKLLLDQKECNEVRERLKFLKVISPDSYSLLKKDSCKDEIKTITESEIKLDNILEVFRLNEPKYLPLLEEKFKSSPEQQAQYFINKNNGELPLDEIDYLHFDYVFTFWKNFSFTCNNLQVDSDTRSDSNIEVTSTCNIDEGWLEPKIEDLEIHLKKQINELRRIMYVQNSTSNIIIENHFSKSDKTSIGTTSALAQKLPEKRFIPSGRFVLDILALRKNGSEKIGQTELFLVENHHVGSNLKYRWQIRVAKNTTQRLLQSSPIMTKSSSGTGELIFNSIADLKDLIGVRFKINFSETYNTQKSESLLARKATLEECLKNVQRGRDRYDEIEACKRRDWPF